MLRIRLSCFGDSDISIGMYALRLVSGLKHRLKDNNGNKAYYFTAKQRGVMSWQLASHMLECLLRASARVFKSCRFITIMHTRLKVPAKNSPALLFLSRGKEEERKTTTISCFYPAEEEQSRRIFGGNFQTRAHDGNKAAGLKVTTCKD